jgi:hypothetical protein
MYAATSANVNLNTNQPLVPPCIVKENLPLCEIDGTLPTLTPRPRRHRRADRSPDALSGAETCAPPKDGKQTGRERRRETVPLSSSVRPLPGVVFPDERPAVCPSVHAAYGERMNGRKRQGAGVAMHQARFLTGWVWSARIFSKRRRTLIATWRFLHFGTCLALPRTFHPAYTRTWTRERFEPVLCDLLAAPTKFVIRPAGRDQPQTNCWRRGADAVGSSACQLVGTKRNG